MMYSICFVILRFSSSASFRIFSYSSSLSLIDVGFMAIFLHLLLFILMNLFLSGQVSCELY